MTANPHSPGNEAGFTLVELIVAMTLSILVLFGILNTLDNFTSQTARQTRVTDANEQVRTVADRIVADLRQAATIEVAAENDLVYTVVDSATAYRRERVCRDSSGYLWRSSVTTTTAPSPAIAAGTTCPTPSVGAVKITKLASVNAATTNPLFQYDSTTASSVRSVGITIALNAGNAGRTDTSTLRASAFVRAKGETAPTTPPATIDTTCNSSSSVPTLTLSSTAGPLTVTYTDTAGNTLGSGSSGTAVVLSSATPTATTVIANITSSTGIVSQLVKVLVC